MNALHMWWIRGCWEARRFLVWAGAPGAAALVLIICAGLTVVHSWHLQQEASQLYAAFMQRAALPKAPLLPPISDAGALAQFYAQLPAADTLPKTLNQLLTVGKRAGVSLKRGDYRVEETGQDFIRYQIALPIQGDNQQVLGFVWQALLTIPALAVESVSFQRDSGATANGEAEVRFVLFVRVTAADRVVRMAKS